RDATIQTADLPDEGSGILPVGLICRSAITYPPLKGKKEAHPFCQISGNGGKTSQYGSNFRHF
ncbi:hypothetical protein, partial [Bradyrhizobium sp. JYMT SZCCT0180]|uniref:hypothetical protein n=1 Tax=Bradyrhizobium sp. JYMT SZCCT0180 TaxID=2807666 RepID=UPI001BACD82C